MALAYLLAVAGQGEPARKALAAAGDFSEGEICVDRARVHAVLQEPEAVLEWLGRAVKLHHHLSPGAAPEPEFKALADDERFKRLDDRIRSEQHEDEAD